MAHTILRAGCKVNLTLDITGRRADGMHEIRSLFWPVREPHDDLILKPGEPGAGIRVRCARPDVDADNNTLTKAWQIFREMAGEAPDLQVLLHKGIPSGAGLGGGSADAAVLLGWMNSQARRPLSQEKLAKAALATGADVPFFLLNTPCFAEGVGERLTPIPELAQAMRGWTLLILCPAIHVPTSAAYAAWDAAQAASGAEAEGDLTTDAGPDTNSPSHRDSVSAPGLPFCPQNAFEPVVFKKFPELAELKARLLVGGAAAAVMSGSGSSLCGLFAPGMEETCTALAANFEAEDITVYVNPVV